ncbi:MAG: cysteine desulfurase [Candidatus Azobacteroides sp.]|nr:cysteine desulfurase [Candidatus Azobacteroides sp.]
MFNVQNIRKDFPILKTEIYGKPLIYLDNAATSQKPSCVIEQITHAYTTLNANIHRGVHYLSQQATQAHEDARKTVQRFINARHLREIIFTRGTTEAINLVAFSFGEAFCRPGDEIVISEQEHHSNMVPWQMLAQRKGLTLKFIPINEKGELKLEAFEKLLSEKTRLVSVTHVSNVLGTINPVKEIIAKAHAENIPVLIDGAQSIPHLHIDVQDLDADFFVFSSHKVYGPTGIGVLYGKEKYLRELPPYQGGGEMISSVSFEKTVYNDIPFKFEAGTPDYIGSTGLAAALDYLTALGLENIEAYENELLHYATQEFLKIDRMRIFGTADRKSSVISFLLDGIHHYDTGMLLDKLGIAVRTGHHCAEPLIHILGVEGTVRASFAFYNTKEEIDSLVAGLKRVVSMF